MDGVLDEEGIPTPCRLNRASEKEYTGKTLVTTEGHLERGGHQDLVDSLRADIDKEFTGQPRRK